MLMSHDFLFISFQVQKINNVDVVAVAYYTLMLHQTTLRQLRSILSNITLIINLLIKYRDNNNRTHDTPVTLVKTSLVLFVLKFKI